MSYVPVNDPPPPDDFHTWARPVGPDCPDCKCCTAALCERAIAMGSACYLEGHSADFDLANCPCWRQGSAARERLATGGGVSRAEGQVYVSARLIDAADRLSLRVPGSGLDSDVEVAYAVESTEGGTWVLHVGDETRAMADRRTAKKALLRLIFGGESR